MIMKMYALLIVLFVALTGCTTTYKGSIKGASNPEPSKSSSEYVSNPSGASSSGAEKDK
jgi:hypothetical protein